MFVSTSLMKKLRLSEVKCPAANTSQDQWNGEQSQRLYLNPKSQACHHRSWVAPVSSEISQPGLGPVGSNLSLRLTSSSQRTVVLHKGQPRSHSFSFWEGGPGPWRLAGRVVGQAVVR